MQAGNEPGEIGSVQGVEYAPADFPDVVTRNPSSLLQTVSNLTLYHISSTNDKVQQSRVWRKKVRDILQNHQERILQFFVKPIPNDHPLKVANSLLSKYGKIVPNLDLSKSPPQFLKDYIVDVSGSGYSTLNTYLQDLYLTRQQDSPITRWLNMTRHMLDYMRDVGDELLRLDLKLASECSHLDSVVENVSQLISLPDPDLPGFHKMMEDYIEKQFEKHPIEKYYWDYIYSLQKYSALRDILIPQRIANQVEPVCSICMTESVVMAMVPCGHTFCTNCSKRTTVCHVCRQAVTSRLRVFFG